IPLPHKPLCLTGATASTTVNAATAPQADNHRSTTRMLPSSTERQHKEPSTISGEPHLLDEHRGIKPVMQDSGMLPEGLVDKVIGIGVDGSNRDVPFRLTRA